MSRAILRARLFDLLEQLTPAAERLQEAIMHDGLRRYAWVSGGLNAEDARAKAAAAISAISFPKSGVTHALVGLVGVSSRTFEMAVALNQLKDAFKDAAIALRTMEGGNKPQEVRDVFIEAGYRDLSLRQVYRHVIAVDPPPTRVGFTWLRAQRSIKSISRCEAIDFLERNIRPEFRLVQALDAIHRLPARQALYIAYDIKPHMRANMFFADQDQRIVVAHSPIVFAMEEGGAHPEHNRPSESPPEPMDRLPRKDRVVSQTPLIAGTPLFVGRKSAT